MSAFSFSRAPKSAFSASRHPFATRAIFGWLMTLCLMASLLQISHGQTAPTPWRALDMTTASDNTSRIVWRLPDGRLSFWALNAGGGRSNYSQLHDLSGGWPGWSPVCLSVGSDGLTRVLMSRAGDGSAAVWTLNSQLNYQSSSPIYGPHGSVWNAVDLAVAHDGSQRILWRRSDGAATVWHISSSGAWSSSALFGPYGGWTARALAVGGDGKTRVLWNSPSEGIDIWVVRPDGTQEGILPRKGPYANGDAVDIAMDASPSSDNKVRVMWKRTDGQVSLWKLSGDGNSFEINVPYGPSIHPGWSQGALSVGGDGNIGFLWLNTSGRTDMWRLSSTGGGPVVNAGYGPLPLRIAPPANLSATAGAGEVRLGWSPVYGEERVGVPGAASYRVYRGTTSGTYASAPVATLTGGTTTAFTDTSNLTAGTTYFYVVRAVDGASGESLNSQELRVTVPQPPSAPTNLGATAGITQIGLQWSPVTGATGYKVFQRVGGAAYAGGTPVPNGATTYTATGLTNGTTYFFVVRATGVGGESAHSNEASATPVPPAPVAPSGFTAVAGDATIRLNWTAVANATSYEVHLASGNGTPSALLATRSETNYPHNGLINGQTYSYLVRAIGPGGTSPFSNVASAMPQAPPAIPGGFVATPGNGRVDLRWSASERATSYTLKSAPAASGPYTAIAPNSNALFFAHKNLTNGTTYFYVLSANGVGGTSADSAPVSATPVAPPAGVLTGLTAQGGDLQVTLRWNAAPGAAAYQIFRAEGTGAFPTTPLTTVAAPATTHTDTGLTAGTTYHYRVRATNAGGAGESATVSITVYARLRFDARIAPASGADTTWIGGGIINASGEGQNVQGSAFAGGTASYKIEVGRSGGDGTSQTIRVTAPDWSAFTQGGWTARFFNAHSGGSDVTDLVLGVDGWQPVTLDGQKVELRVEVIAPESATAGTTKSLLVRATETNTGKAVASDTVKATTLVRASSQPDVAVRQIKGSVNTPWTGAGVTDQTEQLLSTVAVAGALYRYEVRVKNSGADAVSFTVQLPKAVSGWTDRLFDSLDSTNEITTSARSESGWQTPQIAPGGNVSLRIEVSGMTGVPALYASSIKATSGSKSDLVKIKQVQQTIAGLEWSRDGKTWEAVMGQTLLTIERTETIGVRAVKAFSDAGWPEPQAIGPSWTWQNRKVEGERVWLHGDQVTGAAGTSATAQLGSSATTQIRVLPTLDVSLSVSRGQVLAGAGPTNLKTVEVSTSVLSDDGVPQPGVVVVLRALHQDKTPAGSWGAEAGRERTLTTDGAGRVQAMWTSDSQAGNVRFEALVMDDAGKQRVVRDHASINANAPYARLDLGEWQEVDGMWSRSVRVSSWYLKTRMAGSAIVLNAQVKDYETGTAVSGWEDAAPFDAATGTTDATGNFTTVQRWVPIEAGAWPHDYEIVVGAAIN